MRKNSSSAHETFDLTRRDGPLCDADFAEFRAECHRIVREKTTPEGMQGVFDALQEAWARFMAARTEEDATADLQTNEEFLAIRKAAGLKIDARIAEVTWCYAQTLDPYGICELPEECRQVGREYFARAPGSDIWVWLGDLPQETSEALWEAHKRELAFPAGLPIDLLCRHSKDSGT